MTMTTDNSDIIHDSFPSEQAAVRSRLDQIWAACAERDFELLESFHLYGPKFTAFKEGGLRDDAEANAFGERALFSNLESPGVDMRDLAINVFGEVAVVTFNGHFTGAIHGNPVALDQQATLILVNAEGEWKIVHEHMSPLGPPPDLTSV